MVTKKNSTQTTSNMTVLTICKEDFQKKLSDRISIGDELYNRNIYTSSELDSLESDFNIWNDYNLELLKQVFNHPNNEYANSYNQSGYSFMGQIGEGPKELIEYKLNNLKSLLSRSELIKSEVINPVNELSGNFPKGSINEVFIVHGHDELAKTKTARFVERLGLIPIILHEQISAGKTIIEKIEEFSNVGFGIVLYTPCDLGCKKGSEDNLLNRARQNVVFEHGFLIGKIGRKNVCALVKDDIEVPNDIDGVVYIKMDDDDSWQVKVAKELRNSGFSIDMNKL
jgi:predicted nucleotide-binding protein